MTINQNEEKITTSFKTSTIEDIYIFNPKINEQYLIQTIELCPFTNLLDVCTSKAYVIDFFQIQDSKFNLCFCYVNNYGLDSYIQFEKVKVIKKLK
ncbi:hypothetical protein L5F64_00315 [Aliarcobacter butzleri]|uniref:hypothetical protein n=1 Tax=Aliarcobacter butzleri TaxID=28197 RepID=UPI001EDB4904|nr:hypothetical protein [Aliarcobacter butzleri]MCG3711551.1 hypothetical protein [Aliarcobacter butzleri]MCG3714003.1 hypothetical protein [Aliarcobacter butzleri]